jgi:beta-lactamase regulating signal transducer with metallopeptidase domain
MRTLLFALSQPALFMWLLKATALLLAALAATTMLRRASAGSRHLVWLATLVAILLLPALSFWTPVSLAILPDISSDLVVTTSSAVSARGTGTPAPASVAARVPSGAKNSGASPAVGREQSGRPLVDEPAFPLWRTLLVFWAGISFALLGWLAFGAVAVRRIVRRASPLDEGPWTAPLCEIADRLDLDAVPRLLASAQVEMPFACGILRPTVVLPSSAEQWSGDRRRAVLFHELAHVRRRDLVGHTLGRIACALYWFHPLVWTAARRLRAESERACDDLVLSCGARASDYADHLLDIVVGVRRHGAPATALPMARRRELEGRVLAILDPAIARVGPGRLQSVGLVVALGTLALSIAAVAPARRPAPPPEIISSPNAPPLTVERRTNVAPVVKGESTTRQPQLLEAAATDARVGAPAAPLVAPTPEPREIGTPAAPGSDSAKVALLTHVLRTDSDASVRRAAAWGLSEAHNHRAATDALLEALRRDEDDHVREMAAWALAGSSREDVLRALAEAVRRDDSEAVRETSVWALASSDAREQIDALEKALSDESDAVRETAAWALGEMPRRPASRALVAALRDGAPEVRETAAWALAEIEDSGTAPALAEAFMKETNAEVKMAELRALTMLGQDDQSVLESALTSKDAELRGRAVRMLAGGGAGWPQPRPRPRPRPNP